MKKFKQVMMQWGAPALALLAPALAAADIQQPPGNVVAPSTYSSINQIAGTGGILCVIINWIFWLLIVLTIIFVLVAAFRYLTAAGDPEKVKAAGNTLLYAAIAVVVALIAKGLPYIVNSFVGGGLTGTVC